MPPKKIKKIKKIITTTNLGNMAIGNNNQLENNVASQNKMTTLATEEERTKNLGNLVVGDENVVKDTKAEGNILEEVSYESEEETTNIELNQTKSELTNKDKEIEEMKILLNTSFEPDTSLLEEIDEEQLSQIEISPKN